MRALTLHGPRALEYSRIEDPAIEAADDVIVRVALSAVCGSDLHPFLGAETGYDAGVVPGHEFVGEVVEVGSDVRVLRVGDRVHAPFTTSCGACTRCLEGLTARCERGQLFGWREDGSGLHGAQAEYVRVPMADSTLVAVADGLSDECALLLGDVLSTGVHGALSAAGVSAQAVAAATQPGAGGFESLRRPLGSVAVVGCGPVGLMAVIGALELGAERVVAFDPVVERRSLAEAFGAETSAPVERNQLEELFGGGADSVVEAVGSESSTRLAFDCVRPGGSLASVGVHTRPQFGFTPVEAYDKNLTMRLGRCSARVLMEALLPMATSGRYPIERVCTHRLALAEGVEAYRLVSKRADGCLKVLLQP